MIITYITRTPPCFRSSLMVGAPGTAKTSTALMYMSQFSQDKQITATSDNSKN